MKAFSELNLEHIRDSIILLDIDGTLTADGKTDIDAATIQNIRRLQTNNAVYLCSNHRNSKRNQTIARRIGASYLDARWPKPSRSILNYIPDSRKKPIVVIGDKFLTDRLFAKRIGATFIKVKRLSDASDRWLIKILYRVDDFFSKSFS